MLAMLDGNEKAMAVIILIEQNSNNREVVRQIDAAISIKEDAPAFEKNILDI